MIASALTLRVRVSFITEMWPEDGLTNGYYCDGTLVGTLSGFNGDGTVNITVRGENMRWWMDKAPKWSTGGDLPKGWTNKRILVSLGDLPKSSDMLLPGESLVVNGWPMGVITGIDEFKNFPGMVTIDVTMDQLQAWIKRLTPFRFAAGKASEQTDEILPNINKRARAQWVKSINPQKNDTLSVGAKIYNAHGCVVGHVTKTECDEYGQIEFFPVPGRESWWYDHRRYWEIPGSGVEADIILSQIIVDNQILLTIVNGGSVASSVYKPGYTLMAGGPPGPTIGVVQVITAKETTLLLTRDELQWWLESNWSWRYRVATPAEMQWHAFNEEFQHFEAIVSKVPGWQPLHERYPESFAGPAAPPTNPTGRAQRNVLI